MQELEVSKKHQSREESPDAFSLRLGLAALGAVLGSSGALRSGVVGLSRVHWPGVLARSPRVPPWLRKFEVAADNQYPTKYT